ncbi:hypothetical protein GGS26DRAFT_127682 [Hypomontagnella submonticulosa]|nr:hypothetical protein GGS26DRAFT_127682 [Hypomontagnella submonticulosa]
MPRGTKTNLKLYIEPLLETANPFTMTPLAQNEGSSGTTIGHTLDWGQDPTSKLLCIEPLPGMKLTGFGWGLLLFLRDACGLPCISYFATPNGMPELFEGKTLYDKMVCITTTLIVQLVCNAPQTFDDPHGHLTQAKFEAFTANSTRSKLAKGISLVKDLAMICPPNLCFIFEGCDDLVPKYGAFSRDNIGFVELLRFLTWPVSPDMPRQNWKVLWIGDRSGPYVRSMRRHAALRVAKYPEGEVEKIEASPQDLGDLGDLVEEEIDHTEGRDSVKEGTSHARGTTDRVEEATDYSRRRRDRALERVRGIFRPS